jgi:hypothetical protein
LSIAFVNWKVSHNLFTCTMGTQHSESWLTSSNHPPIMAQQYVSQVYVIVNIYSMQNQVSGMGIPRCSPLRQGKGPLSSRGRFELEVLSVYYYPDHRRVHGAVVLKMSFIQLGGQKLSKSHVTDSNHHQH